MTYKYISHAGAVIILVVMMALPVYAEEDEDIRRIQKEEVKTLIGKPNVTLIDVRYDKNWKKSDMKIAGAIREHPNEIGSWAGKYAKDRMIILYCD
jgi:rhodanese-related sulfurtransferase